MSGPHSAVWLSSRAPEANAADIIASVADRLGIAPTAEAVEHALDESRTRPQRDPGYASNGDDRYAGLGRDTTPDLATQTVLSALRRAIAEPSAESVDGLAAWLERRCGFRAVVERATWTTPKGRSVICALGWLATIESVSIAALDVSVDGRVSQGMTPVMDGCLMMPRARIRIPVDLLP